MGKRNEPINSLFLFFEALPQNLSSSEKVLFKLKDKRSETEITRWSAWGILVSIIIYHLSLITKTYFTMESLILAQDER